jgi:hypothetical protein
MRTFLIVLISLWAMPTFAQTCGNLLPCGNVPWGLPSYPVLRSPTPVVLNNAAIVVMTNTPVPASTATPFSSFITPTPFMDTGQFGDNIATIQALFDATDIPVLNAEGTPAGLDDTIAVEGSLFFSYAKGFTANSFGVFAPMVNFIIFSFLFAIVFAITRLALPVAAALVGAIRKIIQFILDAIPG